MPSELPSPSNGRPERAAWLSSQGLGVLCGQGTVILLAIGSVALATTRDGASQAIAMDDIRGFFTAPSPVHLWFYLLIPLLALYALNTTLATWQNLVRRWRAGIRAPRAYAPALIHSAFLVGLLAHAVGGLAGRELGAVSVGPGWAALGDGREARLVALDTETHADGTTKQIRATVELRGPDGAVRVERVRYNGPLSSGLGSDLLLLTRPHAVAAARLVRGAEHCDLEPGGSCRLADVEAQLLYVHPPIRAERGAFAQVRVRHADGGADQVLSLVTGQPAALRDGSLLTLAGIQPHPALLLRRRHAPGNPWALLASALLVLGLAMLWRRFVPRAT